MVPFLSLASDVIAGVSGCTSEESAVPTQAKTQRVSFAPGTAAQDKCTSTNCSRGTRPRSEKLFESGGGHDTNGFSFVSLARNIKSNAPQRSGKASARRYERNLRTGHATAATCRERWG